MQVVELLTIPEVDAAVREVRVGVTARPEKALLGEFRMHKWRGGAVYALVTCVDVHEYVATALIAVGYGVRQPKLNVYTLFTAREWRGQSCMTVLLDFVEDAAKRRGLTYAVSKASSVASVRLYAKRGYVLGAPTTKGEVPVWWPLTPGRKCPFGAGIDPSDLVHSEAGFRLGYQLELPLPHGDAHDL
jgi:GNAT superfamily N-acetyltransferase